MTSNHELLRGIPKVDEMLSHPIIATANGSDAVMVQVIREVLGELRESILSGGMTQLTDKDVLAEQIVARLHKNAVPSLRRLINATGVILHTNLGRAPLAKSAAEAIRIVAESYSTLEYNVEEGTRGSRHSHVKRLLTDLTGAEDAIVVNNNASAVLLVLSALLRDKEVVVSRGELVEIGGAFRIPDIMVQSGCVLKEVGTTNRTRASDYEIAIVPERTGALLKAHTSNYKIVGFTEDVSLRDLVEISHRHCLPVIYDLGSGSLIPMEQFGIEDEPCVMSSVKEGADIITFSGDKLLGGPQAGIIIGKRELIAKVERHPLARAMRIDKLTLTALEATLRLYQNPEQAKKEIPILQMLSASQRDLYEKADRLFAMLSPLKSQISVVDVDGKVGGGSVPTQMLPSAALQIQPHPMKVSELEKSLHHCEIPIIARIAHDRLLLDMRTVEEQDLSYVASCLIRVLGDRA